MWHEWNTNADDVMMMWFTLYVNPSDVKLGMHNTCDVHVHGTHALHKTSAYK